MNQYEREKNDAVINRKATKRKTVLHDDKIMRMGKNRILSSKGKRSDINFLTIKENLSSIWLEWMLVKVKSLYYFHFTEFFEESDILSWNILKIGQIKSFPTT